jgi:hypothetical protein
VRVMPEDRCVGLHSVRSLVRTPSG